LIFNADFIIFAFDQREVVTRRHDRVLGFNLDLPPFGIAWTA
jgi:hypothetical protein